VLDIHDIAGDVYREDLASAIPNDLASKSKAGQEDAAVLYLIALANYVSARIHLFNAKRHAVEC
jgi:hypothetical protein